MYSPCNTATFYIGMSGNTMVSYVHTVFILIEAYCYMVKPLKARNDIKTMTVIVANEVIMLILMYTFPTNSYRDPFPCGVPVPSQVVGHLSSGTTFSRSGILKWYAQKGLIFPLFGNIKEHPL